MLVIIPNFSRNDTDVRMLRRCLRAVRRYEPNVAIFIWDDASPLKDKREIIRAARLFHASLYLATLKCESYSDIINQALDWGRRHGHRRFCTMNSDVEPITPFLETATGIWDEGLADVFGGTLLYPTGRIQSAGFTVKSDGSPLEYSKNESYLTDVASKRAQFVPGVTGAMQFFHSGCGLYPAGYNFGYEDIHFCLKQWKEDRSVLYVPSIEAVHSESVTRGRFPSQDDLDTIAFWHATRGQFNIQETEERATRRTLKYLAHSQSALSRLPRTHEQDALDSRIQAQPRAQARG
jgi:GT2 family glycosyltransferase